MTEKTDDQQQDSSDYLVEPFVTEDGLEVPPPTRPMGPRRLARYRDDAAKYLRAVRDGLPLPEEPVAFMPPLEATGETDESTKSIQDRFSAIAAQGGIDTSAEAEPEIFATGGKDTREDVSVADEFAQSASSTTDESYEAPSATDFEFGDVIVEEDEIGFVEEEPAEASEEQLVADEEEKESEEELPQPVAALNAQGLDLSELDQNERETDRSENGSERAEESAVSEEKKKSGAGLWVTLLLLLLIAAAVIFWFVFMQ